MAKLNIKVLALDLDGTLTNDDKQITPRTRAALDQALAKGVMVVLASGRPTEGVTPVARDLALGQNGRAGAILSYNGGAIVDCGPGARILWQQVLPAPMVPALCSFAAQLGIYRMTGRCYCDVRPEHNMIAHVDIRIIYERKVEIRIYVIAEMRISAPIRVKRRLDVAALSHRCKQLLQKRQNSIFNGRIAKALLIVGPEQFLVSYRRPI